MYCERCGTNLQEGQHFCPVCGKSMAAGAVPVMAANSRVAGHMRLLAIFWIAVSAFRLLPGIFLVFAFGRGINMLPPDAPFFIRPMLHVIGELLIAGAAIGFITGWALLEKRPWARTLAIVLAFLNLLDVPFGTALGTYTFWVLLPAESEREYQKLAGAS